MWSVKCEVWSVKEAVRSEKCGVWSVKCGVWSVKCGVRRVQCAVWGVECRGKDTVGTGCLWTIGHLCLGNFRRRLARVYVRYSYIDNYHTLSQLMWLKQCHFYHPWLGMVWIPPIYGFMVMTWGWFMALEVYGIRFNLTTLCHCYARYEAPWKSQV